MVVLKVGNWDTAINRSKLPSLLVMRTEKTMLLRKKESHAADGKTVLSFLILFALAITVMQKAPHHEDLPPKSSGKDSEKPGPPIASAKIHCLRAALDHI